MVTFFENICRWVFFSASRHPASVPIRLISLPSLPPSLCLQVANMFLLPLGMFSGASDTVSWTDIFVRNILPVTLGNIIGGAVFQTLPYAAVYGSLLK